MDELAFSALAQGGGALEPAQPLNSSTLTNFHTGRRLQFRARGGILTDKEPII